MKLQVAPTAEGKDKNDDRAARWGQDQHKGFRTGAYIQSPVILSTADHHPLWLGDQYRGSSVFLIAGGPSFANINKSLLCQPGIMTMGLNNSVKTFRPNMWCCVDNPQNFVRSVWLDPQIQKFVPLDHTNKVIFNSDTWTEMETRVRDCPNVAYYRRNEMFKAKQFLWEDTCNWGNHSKWGGGRSVLLPALRILFYLGFRQVYLLGVDFNMDAAHTYHFDQGRAPGSIKGNSSTYELLKARFTELKPLFDREGFFVHNCNQDSKLDVFPKISFADALDRAQNAWGNVDVNAERTAGLYDRNAKQKSTATPAPTA